MKKMVLPTGDDAVGDKRDFLFRFVPVQLRGRLRLDDVAMYSVTDEKSADKITASLRRVLPLGVGSHVVDGTACVGGNTCSFARQFGRVTAIEIDPTRYGYLRHNLGVLGLDHVDTRCEDVLAWARARTAEGQPPADLIYLDPEWGGPGYVDRDRVELSLSGLPLADACLRLAPAARHIALKVPHNFDEDGFLRGTAGRLVVRDRLLLRKMRVLLFRVAGSPG